MNEQLTTRPAEGPSPPGGLRSILSSRRARLGALIALVVLIGVILWLTVGRSDSSSSSSNLTGSVVATPIAPVALSSSGLSTLARTVGQPIYWAGPRQGYLYELKRT